MNLIKVPFFIVNFIFALLFLSVLGLGIFILTDETIVDRIINFTNLTEILKTSNNETVHHTLSTDPFRQHVTDPISYILITFGSLIFFLSFIGYCGALKDSRCLMATYAVLLLLIFILETTILILYFRNKPDVKNYISEGIKNHYSPDDHPSGEGAKFTIYMDFIMIENKCCGISGEKDFEKVYQRREEIHDGELDEIFAETGRIGLRQKIPEACCRLNISGNDMIRYFQDIYRNPTSTRKELLKYADRESCIISPTEMDSYVGEDNGCFDKIQRDWSTAIILTGVVVGTLQLCGIVFSVFIFRAAYYDYIY